MSINMSEEAKLQGNAEFQRQNYHLAIKHYSVAISLQPLEATYYGNRSAAFFMMYKYEESLQDCQKSLELQPNVLKVIIRAGKCMISLGRLQEAKGWYADMGKLDPDSEALKADQKLLDEALMTESMYQQSLRESKLTSAGRFLDQLLAISTHSLAHKLLKFDLLIQSQQIKEALQYAKDLPSMEPGVVALIGVAMYYDAFPISDKAREIMGNAARMDPSNERVMRVRRTIGEMERMKQDANQLYKQSRIREAVDTYTRALELDPKHSFYNSIIFANRAAAYIKTKEYMKALEDCNRAIELNERYTAAYMRRGNVYVALSRFEDALHDYNTVKDYDRNYPDIDSHIFETKKQTQNVRKKDYYQVLGLQRTAAEGEVKRAYRQLAMKWHPDKNSDTPENRHQSEKMIKDINEAYGVLSDKQKRRHYDLGRDVDGEDFGGSDDFADHMSGFPGGAGDFSGEMGRMAANLEEIYDFFQTGGEGGGIPDLNAAGNLFGGAKYSDPVAIPGDIPGSVKYVWKKIG